MYLIWGSTKDWRKDKVYPALGEYVETDITWYDQMYETEEEAYTYIKDVMIPGIMEDIKRDKPNATFEVVHYTGGRNTVDLYITNGEEKSFIIRTVDSDIKLLPPRYADALRLLGIIK